MKRLVTIAVAIACVATLGVLFILRDPSYTALLPDAAGITKGDDVRIAGINVGEVTDVKARGASVRVEFTTDHQVTQDTRTEVKIGSLLGERYLQLQPGKGKRLDSGDTIALTQAKGSYTLDRFGWMPLQSTGASTSTRWRRRSTYSPKTSTPRRQTLSRR